MTRSRACRDRKIAIAIRPWPKSLAIDVAASAASTVETLMRENQLIAARRSRDRDRESSDLDKRDFSSLVSCGSGGAPLPWRSPRSSERKTNMKLKSGWGMTETCSPGTAHSEGGPDKARLDRADAPGIELDVVALDDPRKICRRARSARSASKGRTSPKVTEPAAGNCGRLCRRPLPDGRYRLHGR